MDKQFFNVLVAYVKIISISPETPAPKRRKIKKLLKNIESLSNLVLRKAGRRGSLCKNCKHQKSSHGFISYEGVEMKKCRFCSCQKYK